MEHEIIMVKMIHVQEEKDEIYLAERVSFLLCSGEGCVWREEHI
jgi:hypothetical protein